MTLIRSIPGAFAWLSAVAGLAAVPVPDLPFPQEVARRVILGAESPPGGVQLVLGGGPGEGARFFVGGRWYQAGVSAEGSLVGPDSAWTARELAGLRGSEAGEFLLPDSGDRAVRLPVPWAEVRQVLRSGASQWVATTSEVWRVAGGQITRLGWNQQGEVRQVAVAPDGRVWVASAVGLFREGGDAGGWGRVEVPDVAGRVWAMRDVRGVAFDAGGRAWVGLASALAVREGEFWRVFEGKDGLPVGEVAAVATGADGSVWIGTRMGLVRFDGRTWAYRQGPRWLPGDEVRGLAVEANGTVWVATSGGAGAIERRPMTLAAKAAHYEEEIERLIKRTPFGYTSEVGLGAPGDRSRITHSDSDNDGLWTAMYGAGECFAYAVTRRPEFQRRARQAFEALRFLQKVTQGGSPAPPKGYVARTIRPVDWPDPNLGRVESDREIQANGDRLWKVYEPRWPKSADGQWYWKSDTSSDELDGHYFFYARYYDLVADEAEKERVREVVRDLTDHLVNHGFRLVDHDGKPTRWGIFDPASLNHSTNWWVERGLNSLSLLSYLAVAQHVTGETRYGEAARDLIDRHGYAANVMNPKTQTGPGSGNQSDDEMAFMCFYNLLQYTRETGWLEKWRYAFHAYAALELPEMNPFFNFAYAAIGRGHHFTNPWGTFPVEPWDGWLEDSLATLRGFPLDRANWPHRNSHRLDLVRLPPQQSVDLYEPRVGGRGHRVNGRVLAVEERHFNHWNTDPWRLDYGGDGRELASGTVFLLPYYMGLYHGFIGPP